MKSFALILCGALLGSSALAAGYNEKKSGDLSNDRLTPTTVKLKVGPNVIAGSFGTKNGATDRDYFTIKVPADHVLDAIILEPETTVGLNLSFIGVQDGKVITVPPVGGSPADLLGYTHFGESMEGTDILPAMGDGAGSKGFTPPLPAGTYTFWVQELATCKCNYRFTFFLAGPAQ